LLEVLFLLFIGFIVPGTCSSQFYDMMNFKIKTNIEMFNVTELMYILKSYHIAKKADEELIKLIEKTTAEFIKDPKNVLLEELCAVSDGFCSTKAGSRDFQKLLEYVISSRLKDILGNPKVAKFLYDTFYVSGVCSVGLMDSLFKSYSG
jgi:hypothetical protein